MKKIQYIAKKSIRAIMWLLCFSFVLHDLIPHVHHSHEEGLELEIKHDHDHDDEPLIHEILEYHSHANDSDEDISKEDKLSIEQLAIVGAYFAYLEPLEGPPEKPPLVNQDLDSFYSIHNGPSRAPPACS